MQQRYGDAVDDLLRGQADAHNSARRALQEAQSPTTTVDPGAQRPPFGLRVRGQTIQQHQVRKNLIERRAGKLLKQHRKSHPSSQAPLLSALVDPSASRVSRWTQPANSQRRKTLLRLRNGSLPTRQRHHAYLERARQQGFTSAFLQRIARTNRSPSCPFGCDVDETDDHLASCPATNCIRARADELILSTLRRAGYDGPSFGWLETANCPISRVWRLAGYIWRVGNSSPQMPHYYQQADPCDSVHSGGCTVFYLAAALRPTLRPQHTARTHIPANTAPPAPRRSGGTTAGE
jgi:hypothetical protein